MPGKLFLSKKNEHYGWGIPQNILKKKVFPLQVHVFTTCKLIPLTHEMIQDAHPAILPMSTKSTESTGVAQDKSHGRCG